MSASDMVAALVDIASSRRVHVWLGLCPDTLQPDSRDPDCPACAVILEAERWLAATADFPEVTP